VDKNKCVTSVSSFVQFYFFESNGAKKTPPTGSKHGGPGATISYFGHPQLFGPGAAGASKWPPDSGKIETSKWSPDPGGDGISKRSQDSGAVGTSKWPPDPGADGTSEWHPDRGVVETSE
jgi:hypothetical protein